MRMLAESQQASSSDHKASSAQSGLDSKVAVVLVGAMTLKRRTRINGTVAN